MILYASRYLENVLTTARGFTVSFNVFVRYFSSHNELLLIYGAYYGQPMAPAFRQSSTDIFANVSILFVMDARSAMRPCYILPMFFFLFFLCAP